MKPGPTTKRLGTRAGRRGREERRGPRPRARGGRLHHAALPSMQHSRGSEGAGAAAAGAEARVERARRTRHNPAALGRPRRAPTATRAGQAPRRPAGRGAQASRRPAVASSPCDMWSSVQAALVCSLKEVLRSLRLSSLSRLSSDRARVQYRESPCAATRYTATGEYTAHTRLCTHRFTRRSASSVLSKRAHANF